MPFCVVKIGGSLIDRSQEIVRNLVELSLEGYRFLVVPGGGPMANLVRDLFQRCELSQEASHWMAILAMEQYAYFMADGTEAKLIQEISEPENGVCILLPYNALLADDAGIEHNWNYTSDSVAAEVSCRLGTFMVKATDVDGVILEGKVTKDISAEDLFGKTTCIDQGALEILSRYGRSCLVLNGTDPKRFVMNLKRKRGGTLIKG